MRYFVRFCFYSLALVLAPSTLGGQEVHRLELADAMRLFAERSLELRVSRALARSDAAQSRQDAAFPNPTLWLNHENLSNAGLGYAETYVAIDQEVDWPWRYAARRGSAAATADVLAATFARDSARLAYEVRRTFVDAGAGERRVAALADVLEVFRQAARAAEARLREGDISGYEVRRLRIELARYEALAVTQELDLRRSRRSLGLLVFGDSAVREVAPRTALGRPPRVSTADLESRALRARPEVAAAAARLNASEQRHAVARASRIPNLTLSGGYKTQTDGLQGIFLGAAWPVPLLHRNGQGVAASNARVTAGRDDVRLAEQLIAREVQDATESYQAAFNALTTIADGLLTGYGDLLAIARASYLEGEMSLIELVDGAAAFWEATGTVIDAESRAWIAYFTLDRAVGGFDAGNTEAP